MGNNQSRPHHATASDSTSASPSQTATTPTRREPRRRESVQALPSVKATAAPPSESRESATAHQTSATTSNTSSTAPVPTPPRPPSSGSRQRSRTIEADPAAPAQSIDVKMGNEESRQRMAANANKEPEWFTPSKPVPVPTSGGEENHKRDPSGFEPAGPPRDLDHIPPSQTHRPPRLPLPIGEEIYTPGSPIISPADITSALNQDPLEAGFPRRSSILSSTTADDEEAGDDLQGEYGLDGGVKKAAVPTLVEWKQKGERVYVTGTFAGWNRKYRLAKNEDGDGFSAIVQLTPGTHHLKFLVDGDMRTADHLPTAVDFSNVLVNYIEIKAEDETRAGGPSKPIDIKRKPKTQHPPPGVHPPLVLPPTPTDYEDEEDDTEAKQKADISNVADGGSTPGPPPKPIKWGTRIPRHLRALDAPEGSYANKRATRQMAKMPPPPALPGFLGKSILNGVTPLKDDSSVLNLPNHTVLNHLATSSIKDEVLAISTTTRYYSKYVTTIMYKPTDGGGEDDDPVEAGEEGEDSAGVRGVEAEDVNEGKGQVAGSKPRAGTDAR